MIHHSNASSDDWGTLKRDLTTKSTKVPSPSMGEGVYGVKTEHSLHNKPDTWFTLFP